MPRTTPARARALLAAAPLAVPALALLAACGGVVRRHHLDDGRRRAGGVHSAAAQAATFPVTVTGDNGAVTIAAQPKKIVSLSPADTEILFAIGAGPQVAAVDDQSNYPAGRADAPTCRATSPNAEAIAGVRPRPRRAVRRRQRHRRRARRS